MRSIHDQDRGSRSEEAGPRTGQKRSREALARRKDELETALAVGHIGYCRLAADARVLTATSEFKAQFGWPPDAQFDWSELEARVHPEDRATLSRAVRAAREDSADLDVCVRVQWPESNEERWVALRGRSLREADGSLQLMIVARDATAERRAHNELAETARREREQRESAQAANRSKDEFLSMFSHELRSPLNAILGWNRILAVKRVGDAEIASITSRIERSAKSQLKMVNDLLDLGRISTGKLKIEPRPTKLTSVIGAALDALRPAAAAKGVEIVSDLGVAHSEVYGDPDRLQQVVWNLLSNAIKFTDVGGRIGILLRQTKDLVELSIADTGQGVAPELLPHVFDRFRQGDSSTTRNARGLGLGLALVREIVALHGGSVAVSSEGLGRGATFTVRLPAMSIRQGAGEESDCNGHRAASRSALAGLSILVVDDEPDARAVVAETLRLEGADVTVSDSAGSAFEELLARDAPFDVVVTDIGMPVEDGYSLVRKLRRMQLGERVLAIALTGYASQSDKQAAIDAGFDLHVAKPVDFDDFVPLIRRLAPQTRATTRN